MYVHFTNEYLFVSISSALGNKLKNMFLCSLQQRGHITKKIKIKKNYNWRRCFQCAHWRNSCQLFKKTFILFEEVFGGECHMEVRGHLKGVGSLLQPSVSRDRTQVFRFGDRYLYPQTISPSPAIKLWMSWNKYHMLQYSSFWMQSLTYSWEWLYFPNLPLSVPCLIQETKRNH